VDRRDEREHIGAVAKVIEGDRKTAHIESGDINMKPKDYRLVFALVAILALAITALGCQKKDFKIGDKGPAGGIVFYDKGKVENGWRYLEAAPSDQSGGIQWYNGGKYSNIETGTDIGAGKANTDAIIAAQGDGNYAAALCRKLKVKGYSDWFLPSKDELDLIYNCFKKTGLGGFGKWWIWSSTQVAKGKTP
jgi:hypothetical protein